MKLTQRFTTALAAVVTLAKREHEGIVPTPELAEHLGVSLSYVEHIFGQLKAQKIVAAVRGANGGYRLAKPASVINLWDICSAVGECDDKTLLEGAGPASPVLGTVTKHIENYLQTLSVFDAVQLQASDSAKLQPDSPLDSSAKTKGG